ncbi:MAG: NAD-dependent epimerase/dehydratase family protein [Terrimicrobiaceae bacterium]
MACPCAPQKADEFLSEPTAGVVESIARIDGDYLVLGAGGKMGLHVCLMLRKALQAAGKAARLEAVSRFRSVHDAAEFKQAGISTRACDLTIPSELESLPQAENIIFMAGAKFGTSGQPELLRKMNIELPEMVAGHYSGSRITAFSTGCVYSFAPVDSKGSDEKSPTEPTGEYAQSCLGREQAFRRSTQELGTRLALIRLNYSVEFRYGVLLDIASKVLRGEPVDVTTGHVNLIWQRDAVAHILMAHELASTASFIVNITGPDVLKVRDLAGRFGELFGREPQFTGRESETAWLNDASLSHRLFGPPETSIDQMIEWIAAWLRDGGTTFNKPTGFEKRDGNF